MLPASIKARYKGNLKIGPVRLKPINDAAIAFFNANRIGNHDVLVCRGSACRTKIVFLDGRYGRVAVEHGAVKPDDTHYDIERHVLHSARCASAFEFSRSRRFA